MIIKGKYNSAEIFTDVIEDFVDGIKELNRIQMNLFNKEFIDYSTNLVNGLNEIFNFLQSTKYLANAKSNSVVFKDVMKNTPRSKILGGINEDFMFQDLVKLPKGSVIVKYNPNIHNTLYNKGMKKKEKVYTNKELKDIAKMDQCYFSNKK